MNVRDFEVTSVGPGPRGFVLGLVAFFGVFLAALLALVFADVLDVHLLFGAVPALVVALAVCALLNRSLGYPRVRLEDGVLYVSRFPRLRARAADFKLDHARVLDLAGDPELRPTLKLFGTRLPGYCEGWFSLQDGSRAFLLVTDNRRVLFLPRRDKGPVLLSLVRPDELLDALRRARG